MHTSSAPTKQRGLSLVELLVAIALGMVIMAALATLYGNVTRSNNEMSKTNQLIENGRFAMQLLQEDVSHAGFYGAIDYIEPTAVPDPCLAYADWPAGAARAAYIDNLLAIPAQGFSDGTPYATCGAALANVVAKSDVLIVRHANMCVAGADCEGGTDTGPHVQISQCRTAVPAEPAYRVENKAEMDARTLVGPPRTYLHTKSCNTPEVESERRKLISNVYFVANSAAGIPTLMRASYTNGAFGAAQALVEGIEGFKVEYGIDNLGSNGLAISATNPPDGNADTYQSCTAATPCTLAVLQNAVSLRIHILARNLEPTAGHTDTKSYTLGPLAVAAANDGYKRHVFTTTVRLNNPSSRRESP